MSEQGLGPAPHLKIGVVDQWVHRLLEKLEVGCQRSLPAKGVQIDGDGFADILSFTELVYKAGHHWMQGSLLIVPAVAGEDRQYLSCECRCPGWIRVTPGEKGVLGQAQNNGIAGGFERKRFLSGRSSRELPVWDQIQRLVQ